MIVELLPKNKGGIVWSLLVLIKNKVLKKSHNLLSKMNIFLGIVPVIVIIVQENNWNLQKNLCQTENHCKFFFQFILQT